MKSFFLFAMICFADPEAPRGISCMDFQEDDSVLYNSPRACYNAANKMGDKIKIQFTNNGIEILEFIIWCVNSKGKII
tara:strand:+ start:131 stop:364 length:234 start_codon:yes stop_codon:yes gene_type:complete